MCVREGGVSELNNRQILGQKELIKAGALLIGYELVEVAVR